MIRPFYVLDLHEELVVDNFAGGGGASTGIEQALGRCVDIAVNHDPEAVALHTANHPQTKHFCEDVFTVDPRAVTGGRPVGLAWFSPDCKHFSKAKGGKPRSKKIRGLAWVAVKWAATVRPRVIILENVEEFQDWGPLLPDGKPCPSRKGKTFRNFVARLCNLGYQVSVRELRACDYGAPTIRRRLFLIARCDGREIVWPEPTHGAPGSEAVRKCKLKPWRTAAECIDWSIPCPSIFLTPEEAKVVGCKRPLADATMRRIARGIFRYVIEASEPFIVPQTHQGGVVAPHLTEHANASGQRTFPADQPLRTQCSEVKGGHFALVSAFLAKHQSERHAGEVQAASLEAPVPAVKSRDSNALVTAQLVGCGGRAGQSRPRDVSEPSATLTTKADTCLVTSNLVALKGGHDQDQASSEPLSTVHAGGNHHTEVRAFLVKYYGNEKEGVDLREPMHTVTARDRLGIVTVEGVDYAIADIGMRMLKPRELYRAQGFPEDYRIEIEFNGKRLSQEAQVRMVGNSVCPPLAAALVAANVPEMSAWQKGELAA